MKNQEGSCNLALSGTIENLFLDIEYFINKNSDLKCCCKEIGRTFRNSAKK